MRNFGKEINKRILQERIIELSNTLIKSGMASVIYLPDVNMFTISGSMVEQLICVGLIVNRICRKTGKEANQVLDEDFYNIILPECKRMLEEGEEL